MRIIIKIKRGYPLQFIQWLAEHATPELEGYKSGWLIETEDHILDWFTTKKAYKYWNKKKNDYK